MAGQVPSSAASRADLCDLLVASGLPQGLLWDLDGTMLECEQNYIDGFFEALRDLGIQPTDNDVTEAEALHGATTVGALHWWIEYLQSTGRVPPSFDVLEAAFWKAFAKILEASPITLLPGVEACVNAAVEAGLPQAMATMSTYREIDLKKAVAPSVFENLRVQIGADHPEVVESPKPKPDVYLVAARELGVDPAKCLAFEDTIRGVKAASAAGCKVIAIPSFANHEWSEFYDAGATVVVKSLADIDFRRLFGLKDVTA